MVGKTTPSDFMATWLQQMNFPKVEVNLTRNPGNTRISFAQSRFLLTPFADGLMPTYISPFKLVIIFFKLNISAIYRLISIF